jgi:hypothetical protein
VSAPTFGDRVTVAETGRKGKVVDIGTPGYGATEQVYTVEGRGERTLHTAAEITPGWQTHPPGGHQPADWQASP